MATGGIVTLAATAQAGTPPNGGGNIEIFNKRSMVALEGYTQYAGKDVTIDLLRGGSVIATAKGALDPSGFFEVNHPGGGCWIGVTPNIKPGDEVRMQVAGEAWTDSAITAAPTVTNVAGSGFAPSGAVEPGDPPNRVRGTGTVTITGTYDPANEWWDPARFNIETVNPDNDDDKTPPGEDPGLSDNRAMGISLVPDAEHPNGEAGLWDAKAEANPTAKTITGTYTLYTQADYDRVLAGDHVFAAWMADGPADLALGLTQNEFEEIPGPGMGGCPASPDGQAPTAPTTAQLSSASGSTSIGVSWTAPAQPADGSAITGYRVAAIGGTYADQEVAERTGATNVSLDGLEAGKEYKVTIEAYNGQWSAAQSVGTITVGSGTGGGTTPPGGDTGGDTPTDAAPAAVSGVTATATSFTEADVTWTASPAGEGVTGYTVTVKDSAGATVGTPVSSTTTSAHVTDLAAGAAYTVEVTATNPKGTGTAGSTTLTQPTGAAPTAGTVTRVLGGHESATVEWNAATAGNSFSPVTGYEVRAYTGTGTTAAATATAGATATSATVTPLVNGTAYRVEVVALGGGLTSAPAAAARGVDLTATPQETVTIARAQARARSATQIEWRVQGTASDVTANQITVVTSAGRQVGVANVAADGTWSVTVTNNVPIPADNRITARTTGGVTTSPYVLTRVR